MTMMFGWASSKESQPLSVVGKAFTTGVGELDKIDKRWIVQGEAGTVLGLSFHTTDKVMEQINKEYLNKPTNPGLDIGKAAKLFRSKYHLPVRWLTLRARVNSPEKIEELLEYMDLAKIETRGAYGIVTHRSNHIHETTLDNSAPVETLPLFVAGTVGQISGMLRENPEMGITPGNMDGRQLLRKIHQELPAGASGTEQNAMAQFVYLKKMIAKLPYSLHWVVLDPLLQYIHAVHSNEYKGIPRATPYLWLGENKPHHFVSFASNIKMFPQEFGKLDYSTPPEGTVKTIYVR